MSGCLVNNPGYITLHQGMSTNTSIDYFADAVSYSCKWAIACMMVLYDGTYFKRLEAGITSVLRMTA